MKEFDKIESTSGSLVIVYNLKLLDSGLPELDVRTCAHDILLSHPELGTGETDDRLANKTTCCCVNVSDFCPVFTHDSCSGRYPKLPIYTCIA